MKECPRLVYLKKIIDKELEVFNYQNYTRMYKYNKSPDASW